MESVGEQILARLSHLETIAGNQQTENGRIDSLLTGFATTSNNMAIVQATLQADMVTAANRFNALDARIIALEGQRSGGAQGRRRQMIEPKHMLPDKFRTEKGPSWKAWRREILEYVEYSSAPLATAMEATQTKTTPITSGDLATLGVDPTEDHEMRNLLVNRCGKGSTAGDLVDSKSGTLGLELWRVLAAHFDPLVENRKLEQTMGVMNPGRAANLQKLGEMIPNWENLFEEKRRRHGDP